MDASPGTTQRACIPAQIPRTGRLGFFELGIFSVSASAKWLSFNAVPQRMIPLAPSRFVLVAPGEMASRQVHARSHPTILATGPTNSAREREAGLPREIHEKDHFASSTCTLHPQESPEIRILFFRLKTTILFAKRGASTTSVSYSPPSPVRVIRSDRTYCCRSRSASRSISLPSQSAENGAAKTPVMMARRTGGDQLFHVVLRVRVPERVETPEIEVPAVSAGPG